MHRTTRRLIAVTLLTATLGALSASVLWTPLVALAQEPIAAILPHSIPDAGFTILVYATSAFILLAPAVLLALLIDRHAL